MKYLSRICMLVIVTASLALAASEPSVRVLLMYSESTVSMSSNNKLLFSNDKKQKKQLRGSNDLKIIVKGNKLVLLDKMDSQILSGNSISMEHKDRDGELTIASVPYGIGWWWANSEDRNYYGQMDFYINQDGKIDVVNTLPIETYLCGVVPSEIGVTAPLDALKAQAVCARSEAMKGLENGKYAGPHYDLTSDVMCQVYSGNNKTNEQVEKAVNETKGEVLSYQGEIISAYYASSCGGHSEDIQNVWPNRSEGQPYWSGHVDSDKKMKLDLTQPDDVRKWIQSEPDVWCVPSDKVPDWTKKNFRWKRTISAAELSSLLAEKYKNIGRVQEIVPLNRGVSGRITEVVFIGPKGHVRVEGELKIRQVWNPPLKSSCFVVDALRKQGKGKLKDFVISGAGWGHGVGMCQTGAIAQANSGINYKKILQHYFRKSKIIKRYR